MIERVLVAVDDSAPALGAAQFAVELAVQVAAEVRFITVAGDGDDPEVMLRHVRSAAEDAGVRASTEVLITPGQPFESILDVAVVWQADVIVMGRSDRRATGRPYVGSQTEHLLEFTPIPVVVVPGV